MGKPKTPGAETGDSEPGSREELHQFLAAVGCPHPDRRLDAITDLSTAEHSAARGASAWRVRRELGRESPIAVRCLKEGR